MVCHCSYVLTLIFSFSSPSEYKVKSASPPCKKGKVSDGTFSEKSTKRKKKSKKRRRDELEVESEKKRKPKIDESCTKRDDKFDRFDNKFAGTDYATKYKKKKKKKRKERN